MLMSIQMILTVFEIAFTFGTIAECHVRLVQICDTAYCAAMAACAVRFMGGLIHLCLKLLLASDLLWIVSASFKQEEEYDKVQ